MPPCVYVRNITASEEAVRDILIRRKPVVAIKCLGVNVGAKGGRITLIALALWDHTTYVFDVKLRPEIMYEGGLLRLLQSTEVLKVLHNCGPDSTALYHQFGVRLEHLFDTQIAHSVIMERQGLSPRRLTFRHICDIYNQSVYEPSPEFRQLMFEDASVWARRPCTREMLNVAASFVRPLIPEIYEHTDSAIPDESEEWFQHLSEEARVSLMPVHRYSGGRPAKCPANRHPTTSVHLVPVTEEMHYCL